MSWALPKGSNGMALYPRPLSWIVVSVGGLAIFLIFASCILVSFPIGSTLRGYFYGVDSSGMLDLSISPVNQAAFDLHFNKSIDAVDKNVPAVVRAPNTSSDLPSVDNVEDTDKNLSSEANTQIPIVGSYYSTNSTVDIVEKNMSGQSSPPVPMGSNASPIVSGAKEMNVPTSVPALSLGLIGGKDDKAGRDTSNVTDNAKIDEPVSEALENMSRSTGSATVPESSPMPSDRARNNSVCDLYHGSWIYDSLGPLYTNNSCPVLTQMQNCQGNGRPDKDYENWQWKPFQCDLPRFDPKKFLALMRGKTLAFIGDSVARNQMESLMCLLWQVEVPKNRGNRKMQKWFFRSTSVSIARIWSSWLVKQTSEPFDFAPAGVTKLHLDALDESLMEFIPNFDVVVLSTGHWFAKQAVYVLNNEIVGGQLWWPDKSRLMKINSIEAFGIAFETALTAIVTLPNYSGITIVRSFSPDHYEGGAWNTGGSCTGKVRPIPPGKLVENVHITTMLEKQVTGFNHSIKKGTNKSKLRFMDITEAFQYRHDGHPGPYRSPDPNKITKRGPDGRPPPQDCLHWCMPGPVDTWNELVLEIIRREYEGSKR
ncbi:Trichome birefringence-like protein [Quillaja saponaria]|uniref:Trichome birefringence-like protein n=1 Tax=Quillaja saponaria TaxID=32244 RepID=A0AAD7PWI6_QUISA|nr:Trichome birefringence-like protein [Quillaja saponaria]